MTRSIHTIAAGAVFAVAALCASCTDPSAPKHNGITYFLLDMKSEGVTVKPLRELTGQEFFNTVYIDDLEANVDSALNLGFKAIRYDLTKHAEFEERLAELGIGIPDLPP